MVVTLHDQSHGDNMMMFSLIVFHGPGRMIPPGATATRRLRRLRRVAIG